MSQEEKQLLLKDLCARLLCGVVCEVITKDSDGYHELDMRLSGVFEDECYFVTDSGSAYSRNFKPYLRPMSSMTEGERKYKDVFFKYDFLSWEYVDWLNAHHFDYHGLIEKGLALKAPAGMYQN